MVRGLTFRYGTARLLRNRYFFALGAQRLKEIRVRPKTGDHDIDTKIAHARKFLEHNDKVQVTVIFRGREMQHQEEGRRVLDAVLAGLAGVGKVERPPAMDGKRMTVLLMPIKAVAKPRINPAAKQAVEAKPTGSHPYDR